MILPSSTARIRRRRAPKRSIRTAALAAAALVVALISVPAAVVPAAAAPAPTGPKTVYESTSDSATLTVGNSSHGYLLQIDKARFKLTTKRAGAVVLATVDDPIPAYDFKPAGSSSWVGTTSVRSDSWDGHTLNMVVNTTNPDYSVLVTVDPSQDRYALNATVQGVEVSDLAVHYDMAASGHWYGHGETVTPNNGPHYDQPWPLDSSPVKDTAFGPASYYMVEPFWFTSKASGILINTNETLTVSLGASRAGEAGFQLQSGKPLEQTVFVEDTPAEVYHDYVGITGTPTKSDAPDYQYESTVWNSWAQFYDGVTQASFLDWARSLHESGIPAHTFNVDDGWMSHYGDFTFNSKFPDPQAMVDEIHSMGYKFGLWVTLWLNTDSQNYQLAKVNGWLLKSASDPTQTCDVTWWNGKAGIVDLANPAAKAWYEGQLNSLVSDLGVDGYKFDTRFFDERCAPYSSDLNMADYQTLGAEMADQYDLQGMGIRVHWTGSQKYGFVTREGDKGTGWDSLQAGMHALLALSTTGHQFVTSDMIGGSLHNDPPTKQVLVRWAQAAALTPLMYSSTAPTGVTNINTGAWVPYDQETVQLYKEAVEQHGALAPYILRQKDRAVATGEPIMKPLFWDFPDEQPTYTIGDEWLLGDSLLAAPVLENAVTRDIYLPEGKWFDPYHDTTIDGGRWVKSYPAPLNVLPMFIRQGAPQYQQLKAALADLAHSADGSVAIATPAGTAIAGEPFDVTTTLSWWGRYPLQAKDIDTRLAVPSGWTAAKVDQTGPSKLRSGDSMSTTWQVTPAQDAAAGSYPLEATVSTEVGRDLQSFTGSASVKLAAVAASLAAAYNNVGITDDDNPGPGDFDGSGNSFSAQALADAGLHPGDQLSVDGVDLTWPDLPAGVPDNVKGTGIVKATGQGKTLGFLGSGTTGATGTVSVRYTDGTSTESTLTFPNWTHEAGTTGAKEVAASDYRNTPSGPANFTSTYRIFYYGIPIDPTKQLSRVTLPDSPAVHIFAMGVGG